jgi:hypothetical protein
VTAVDVNRTYLTGLSNGFDRRPPDVQRAT